MQIREVLRRKTRLALPWKGKKTMLLDVLKELKEKRQDKTKQNKTKHTVDHVLTTIDELTKPGVLQIQQRKK